MISSLRLINFKPFANQFLEFKPLTLLSGLNSTGKSSVLQSLLLLRQSYQQSLFPNVGLALNGDLVCIGTAKDALFEAAQEDSISFELAWEDGSEGLWRFDYDQAVDVLNLTSPSISQEVYQSSLFTNNFHYLQAERLALDHFLRYQIFKYGSLDNLELEASTLHTSFLLMVTNLFLVPN